jgi:Fur family peroxide stress response transcriptional regulator
LCISSHPWMLSRPVREVEAITDRLARHEHSTHPIFGLTEFCRLRFMLPDGNNSQVKINRTTSMARRDEDVSRWCHEFEQLCRRRGIRVTPQRLAVYRAVAEDLTHPTAEAVYRRLKTHMTGTSQATVYRALEFLERENLVRRVSAPEATARFDANVDSHQHIVCKVCGRLTDVVVPAFQKPRIPSIPGFTVEELDIRLVGRCDDCSASRLKKRGRRPAARTLQPKS